MSNIHLLRVDITSLGSSNQDRIVFDEVLKENIRVDFNMYAAEMEEVWKITEPGLQLELESVDLPGEVLTQEFTNKLLNEYLSR